MIMTIRARCSGDCLHTHTQPTHQQAIDCKIISAKAGLVGYHLNLTQYFSFCKDKKGEIVSSATGIVIPHFEVFA